VFACLRGASSASSASEDASMDARDSSLLSHASRTQYQAMTYNQRNSNFHDVFAHASSITLKPLSWFNLPGALSLLLLRNSSLAASPGSAPSTPTSTKQRIVAPPPFAFEPCHVMELLPLWYMFVVRVWVYMYVYVCVRVFSSLYMLYIVHLLTHALNLYA
jgi:hypothetical protein